MNKYLATYGKPRFLGILALDDDGYDIARDGRLIVALSHRGEEMAEVVGLIDDEQEAGYRNMKTISEHGEGPVRGGEPIVTDLEFIRFPTEDDMETHFSHSEDETENLRAAHELVEWHQLSIKLIDAELLLDEKKLFFYFTSDQRVDFRTLVKDLARRFRTRIELRQVGVRDEARIIKGISSCGLPCCCSYWLNEFSPIGIKMVKEQNIALNPAKISGICGRLMCCMSFEHKVYKDLWTGMPNPGSKIKTPQGNYVISSMDIAREAICCRRPTGGEIAVPILLFADFKQAVMNGEEWEVPEDAISEFDLRKRSSCEPCMRFTNQIADRAEPIFGDSAPKKAIRGRDRSKPEGRDRRDSSEGQGEEEIRKRPNRRRGKRGAKKPPQATPKMAEAGDKSSPPRKSIAQDQQNQGMHQRKEHHDKNRAVPVEVSSDASGDEAKARRPRRRRRRPPHASRGKNVEPD